jgi:signal transduction histidine kinase
MILLAGLGALVIILLLLIQKKKQVDSPHKQIISLFDQPGMGCLIFSLETKEIIDGINIDQLFHCKRIPKHVDDLAESLATESKARLSHITRDAFEGKSLEAVTLKTTENTYLDCAPLHASASKDQKSTVFVLKDVSQQFRHTTMMENENEALKNDVLRYSSILNTTEELIWVRNVDQEIVYCNLPYMKVVDESGQHAIELKSGVPELSKASRNIALKVANTKQAIQKNIHLIIGGQRRLFSVKEVPVPDGEGTIGFARDITDWEEAQQEIERHISAQADLLESSTSAMAIYSSDRKLRFYNSAFVALWKLDESWLDTNPSYGEIIETMRTMRKLPEQANFKAFKEQRVRMFTDLLEPEEEFFYLPDGKTLRVVAIPHASGGLMFAYEDVTDRLALERNYNTLIAVQKETLDNLQEGVIVFGENGRLRLYNPVFAKIWSLSENDLAEQMHINEILEKIRHFLQIDSWEEYKQKFSGRLQTRNFYADRLERTDGKVLSMTIVPLPDGGTLITFTDITDSTLVERSLRERNDALQAADRLKTEFLANVSYELRSPLTSISGFSEMLRQNYFGELNDQQREYIEGIHDSSQQLMHLINDILDLASIEAGYMTLNIRNVEIKPLLKSVLSLLNERMKRFSIRAELDCPDDISLIPADETRLKQVLFHLLSNAVKYSSEEGLVRLGATEEEDGVCIFVADEGVGIDPEEQKAVFDKFYRGQSSSGASGTGLGLSMVQSFIQLHGGKVELESEVGEGTTVRCFLPETPPVIEQKKHMMQEPILANT